MKLTRTDFLATGILGTLTTTDLSLEFFTLEHAYLDNSDGTDKFVPKVPPGVYTCKRGMHQLDRMPIPFETFKITGVVGHDNILFHVGNTNADSSGCVLLGKMRLTKTEILQSRAAFAAFMDSLKYVDLFELTVI